MEEEGRFPEFGRGDGQGGFGVVDYSGCGPELDIGFGSWGIEVLDRSMHFVSLLGQRERVLEPPHR